MDDDVKGMECGVREACSSGDGVSWSVQESDGDDRLKNGGGCEACYTFCFCATRQVYVLLGRPGERGAVSLRIVRFPRLWYPGQSQWEMQDMRQHAREPVDGGESQTKCLGKTRRFVSSWVCPGTSLAVRGWRCPRERRSPRETSATTATRCSDRTCRFRPTQLGKPPWLTAPGFASPKSAPAAGKCSRKCRQHRPANPYSCDTIKLKQRATSPRAHPRATLPSRNLPCAVNDAMESGQRQPASAAVASTGPVRKPRKSRGRGLRTTTGW
jgi:hypothetical protein